MKFPFFSKKSASTELVVDERFITPKFLKQHHITLKHLIDDSWVAWYDLTTTGPTGGIGLDGGDIWPLPSGIRKYALAKTREEALAAAVKYLAGKGVEMLVPPPTPCIPVDMTPPTVTPIPLPQSSTRMSLDELDADNSDFSKHLRKDWEEMIEALEKRHKNPPTDE